MRKLFAFTIAAALAVFGGPVRAQSAYITLSSYYAGPGEAITVSGGGFGASHDITVSAAGSSVHATSDASGMFSGAAVTVPLTAVNTTLAVNASGGGQSASADVVVKNFYPVVQPSSYYILPGNKISFTGSGFMPNEHVMISGPGSSNVTANTGGNISTPEFNVGYAEGDIAYNFTGASSGTAYKVIISVAKMHAYLLLSSYYDRAGSNITVTGKQFGANESVHLTFGSTDFGMIHTDHVGAFEWSGTVPSGLTDTAIFTATGASTGRSASATFTVQVWP